MLVSVYKKYSGIFLRPGRLVLVWMVLFIPTLAPAMAQTHVKLFPLAGAVNVNPDSHLELTFDTIPALGSSGEVRVYDAQDHRLVDRLDLSIPAGPVTRDTTQGVSYTPVPYVYRAGRFTNANTLPGTPSGVALPTSQAYQLSIIGGFTDGFRFYPVIINGNKAIITLHHNLLEYNHQYIVQIDNGVLSVPGQNFEGISGRDWQFTTKPAPPSAESRSLVVSSDGTADFSTVQGALDFIPDSLDQPVTIFIRNGIYPEIVYLRNKHNVILRGESRDGVVIQYANNEIFNPHPVNVKTNEMPGTFPSRRAVFAIDHCRNIELDNLTIRNLTKGQAEGLLVNGEVIRVVNVTIVGSGDALQTNGSVYYSNCLIIGDGDTVLGRGAAFFRNCELQSYGPFMWIRNTDASHGNVFVECRFRALGNTETVLARCPANGGKTYPYSEAVLIDCQLSGISPEGWGPVGGETSRVRYWEFHSTNLKTGQLVDVSQRNPVSRQLSLPNDSILISNYHDPAFVLGSWAAGL